nr:MAG TPA: hypothetical protein [Caudoviricetes sp.]
MRRLKQNKDVKSRRAVTGSLSFSDQNKEMI